MSEHAAPRRARARPPRQGNRPALILAIILALVIAAGGTAALVFWPRTSAAVATPTATSDGSFGPTIVSETQLREFAATHGAFYWAGPRADAGYELTRTADGTVYLRYLTADAVAGDASDQFDSIASYSRADAYTDLLSAAQVEGATSALAPDGALVVTNPQAPSSAYLGYDGSTMQVEVYSPVAQRAVELATSGAIEVLQ